MIDQIKFLKRVWKVGTVILLAVILVAVGLIWRLSAVLAAAPSLFVTHLGTNLNDSASDWSHNPSVSNGNFVQLYAEVGTHVADAADNVLVKFELPGSFAASGTSTVRVTSTTSGVAERTDAVNWTYKSGQSKLVYVPGSAAARVDLDRDGTAEFTGPISDEIVTSGINLGNFTNGLAQINFKARVESAPGASPSPSPSPSPTPSPSPSPSPAPGQSQTQTQTITINNPTVTTAAVPAKQPATGPSEVALATMFGAGPLGVILSRFKGRGPIIEEGDDLADLAEELFRNRGRSRNSDLR